MDRQRLRQIDKFKGQRCCVCGKWGAAEMFCEPVSTLLAAAEYLSITVRLPSSNAVHEKCLRRLKTLVGMKRSERNGEARI